MTGRKAPVMREAGHNPGRMEEIMTLYQFISVLHQDEAVQIIRFEDIVFCGSVSKMHDCMTDDMLQNSKVVEVYNGFGGLCIHVEPVK